MCGYAFFEIINSATSFPYVYETPVFYSAQGIVSLAVDASIETKLALVIDTRYCSDWLPRLMDVISKNVCNQITQIYAQFIDLSKSSKICPLVDLNAWIFDGKTREPMGKAHDLLKTNAFSNYGFFAASGMYKTRLIPAYVKFNLNTNILKIRYKVDQIIYLQSFSSNPSDVLSIDCSDFDQYFSDNHRQQQQHRQKKTVRFSTTIDATTMTVAPDLQQQQQQQQNEEAMEELNRSKKDSKRRKTTNRKPSNITEFDDFLESLTKE